MFLTPHESNAIREAFTVPDYKQELGCPPELRRRILGHAEPGVNAIYSHAKQIELTREWLDKLAQTLFTTEQGRKTI